MSHCSGADLFQIRQKAHIRKPCTEAGREQCFLVCGINCWHSEAKPFLGARMVHPQFSFRKRNLPHLSEV